jgi:hypothetical protein
LLGVHCVTACTLEPSPIRDTLCRRSPGGVGARASLLTKSLTHSSRCGFGQGRLLHLANEATEPYPQPGSLLLTLIKKANRSLKSQSLKLR